MKVAVKLEEVIDAPQVGCSGVSVRGFSLAAGQY